MSAIIWGTVIIEKKAKILAKEYFYWSFLWGIFLLVGLLILFSFFIKLKDSDSFPNFQLYLYTMIFFLFFVFLYYYKKISIIKIGIIFLILGMILGIISGATSWEEKLPRIFIPSKYGMPFLVFLFYLIIVFVDRKSRIVSPFEKVYVTEDSIVVGNQNINTSDGIITIQVAGNVWPKQNDFFVAKIIKGMNPEMPLITYKFKQKVVYLTLPFDRQQIIQFLKAISYMKVVIEYEDFCGNSCSWLTENIQIPPRDIKQKDNLNKRIILKIYERLAIA